MRIMRKSFSLLAMLFILSDVQAQAPEKFSYQAVIRDANDQLISNETIGMQLSIWQGDTIGSAVYVETHAPTTNDNGLVSIEIGGGTVENGFFAEIDWADGPYYLKREIDPNGGTNYTISGFSELLSVPYALYAKKVEHYANGAYVLEYDWQGPNSAVLLYTTTDWEGDRTIMMNGYVHLEFYYPQEAIDNDMEGGTANLSMYLKYNGQVIMPVDFKGFPIGGNAKISLPVSALIPSSTAGTSAQFELFGAANSSYTHTDIPAPPDPQIGPYPINVKVTVVFSWIEL